MSYLYVLDDLDKLNFVPSMRTLFEAEHDGDLELLIAEEYSEFLKYGPVCVEVLGYGVSVDFYAPGFICDTIFVQEYHPITVVIDNDLAFEVGAQNV